MDPYRGSCLPGADLHQVTWLAIHSPRPLSSPQDGARADHGVGDAAAVVDLADQRVVLAPDPQLALPSGGRRTSPAGPLKSDKSGILRQPDTAAIPWPPPGSTPQLGRFPWAGGWGRLPADRRGSQNPASVLLDLRHTQRRTLQSQRGRYPWPQPAHPAELRPARRGPGVQAACAGASDGPCGPELRSRALRVLAVKGADGFHPTRPPVRATVAVAPTMSCCQQTTYYRG
jgi:hypothetical protein